MKKYTYLFVCSFMIWGCSNEASFNNDAGYNNSGGGQGGSLARFTIINNHLHVVNENKLNTFEIIGKSLTQEGSIELDAFAETIFPFKNHLLIGTRTGMHIYGLSNPANPNFVSQYSHFASCDPVVAQGNYAYVTLRNGTPCMWGQNQLDILNIANFESPNFLSSKPMLNPEGLAVRGNRLYICEGTHGFGIYDITNPEEPQDLAYRSDLKAHDVIAIGNRLILTTDDGVFQYSVNENDDLQLLSSISIGE